LNCRFAVNGMKKASRLLAAGAVFGGVMERTLKTWRGADCADGVVRDSA
jgi:hypothetical protein